MVAFSNTQSGMLLIGVNDKTGVISGLSFEEIQATNALLVNSASENVKPAIMIKTETVIIDGQNVLVATIPQGKHKPYKDNKGIVWMKNGLDKRKVISDAELRGMMQSCGMLSADTDSVDGSSYNDISGSILKYFLFKRYTTELFNAGIFSHLVQSSDIENIVQAIDPNLTIEKLLKNISLMDEKTGQLTLSGLLLLGKSIQRYRPAFTIKGVSFVGNGVAATEFRDKLPELEVEGSLLKQYIASMSFINRNLKTVQVEKKINSAGQLEISSEVFIESLTNAFIHRDYSINLPIRLYIFDNRIEIRSPGVLPDSVTAETIIHGISAPRNQLLFDNAKYLLPYTGIGSGLMRAKKIYDKIIFKNNIVTEEFVVTILRDEVIEGIEPPKELVYIEDELIKEENDRVNFPNDLAISQNDRIKEKSDRIKNEISQVFSYINDHPFVKIDSIMKQTQKSDKTVRRYLKMLKDNGSIEYVGSNKTGGYRVVTKSTQKK